MFQKFFGKKNDGFYMQVDESASPNPKTDSPQADQAKKDVVAKTEAAPAKESVATQPSAIVAEPTTALDQNEPKAKSAKTSIKKDKKDKKAEEQITAGNTPTARPEPAAPAITNFATDYLVTAAVAGNRRRPGANMKGFMTMARDVKEMKKGSQGNQIKQKAAEKTKTEA